jgi:hypothetical protein
MFAAALWMALAACDEAFDGEPKPSPPRTTAVGWMEWAETAGHSPRLIFWDVDVFDEPVIVGRVSDPPGSPAWDGRTWRYQHVHDGWEEDRGCVRYILNVTAPDLYWSHSPQDRLHDLMQVEPRVKNQIRIW